MSTVNTPTDWGLQRPGLAYQHAFDWLAVQVQATDGLTGCWVPGLFQGVEVLRRLPGAAFLDPIPPELPQVAQATGLSAPTSVVGPLAAIAWVEPRYEALGQLTTLIEQLAPRGQLYVIAGGLLARFLAERRQQRAAWAPASRIRRQLQQHGLRLTTAFGLHGLGAIAWHYAGLVGGRLGRPDWQDRCHYGMRRAYVVRGWRYPYTALVCLVAERAG